MKLQSSLQFVAVLWIGSIGLGFFMFSIFPGTIILAGQQIKLFGRLTGIFIGGAYSGAMLLPWVILNRPCWIGPNG